MMGETRGAVEIEDGCIMMSTPSTVREGEESESGEERVNISLNSCWSSLRTR